MMTLIQLTVLYWRQRTLLKRLVWREVVGRYRGSWLGLSWSVLTPLLMLAIYTFIFGVVFAPRISANAPGSHFDFALSLFSGLIVFNFFAEAVTRAPGLIVANPNYVKKVVFPLSLIPLSAVMAALFHACISILIMVTVLAATGRLSPWAWALPLAWVPLVLFVLGLTWLLAALGVYLRDIGQLTGMATTALLFLSPVFYPLSALPPALQPWLYLNPLTVPIETTRHFILDVHKTPALMPILVYSLIAIAIAALGAFWFEKTKKGFADVL